MSHSNRFFYVKKKKQKGNFSLLKKKKKKTEAIVAFCFLIVFPPRFASVAFFTIAK